MTSLIEIFTYCSVSYGIVYAMPLGKSAFSSLSRASIAPARLQRVRARLQEDRDRHRRLAVELRLRVVGLRAELDARDVLQAHDRAGLGRVHDDLLELFRRREPALRLSPSR